MRIRQERAGDEQGISALIETAFGRKDEARLVERLRMNPKFAPELSLLVELEGEILAHVLFFPIHIVDEGQRHPTLALAPISVSPRHQRMGYGSRLIYAGFCEARKRGYESVIVLGHPDYYVKFGFLPASQWDIHPPFPAPDEAFMAIELEEEGLALASGTVEYPEEFYSLT